MFHHRERRLYRARAVKARLGIAGALTAAAILAAPAAASAAAVSISPTKSCYRSGEGISFAGTGYTPNSTVSLFSDGKPINDSTTGQPARPPTDAVGSFGPGTLTPALRHGQKVKTYTATDDSNPAITASGQLLVSALTVNLKPKKGRPDRRFKIGARGFTTGKRLYAHIVKGKFRRTVKIGRLKGACHKLTARKRLFPSNIATGVYRVQFDSKRKYSKKTKVKVLRGFQVTRRFG